MYLASKFYNQYIMIHLSNPSPHYVEQSEGPYGQLSALMNEWMERWNAAHSFLSDILPPKHTLNSRSAIVHLHNLQMLII